jgi:hypothetical protein
MVQEGTWPQPCELSHSKSIELLSAGSGTVECGGQGCPDESRGSPSRGITGECAALVLLPGYRQKPPLPVAAAVMHNSALRAVHISRCNIIHSFGYACQVELRELSRPPCGKWH